MGCGASASAGKLPERTITEEEQEEMCSFACKLMIRHCAEQAIRDVSEGTMPELSIKAPGRMVARLKAYTEKLRRKANTANDKGEHVAEEKKKGGFLSTIGASITAAAGAVKGAARAKKEQALRKFADTIEQATNSMDAAFTTVGQEIVSKKSDAILEVYNSLISECEFVNVRGLIRHEPPYGQEEYAACAPDKITRVFSNLSAPFIIGKLSQGVGEEIAKSKVVNYFNKCKVRFTDANDMIGADDDLRSCNGDPVEESLEMDINTYLLAQIVEKLGIAMGAHEAEVRREPAGKVDRFPDLFCLCFSGEELTMTAYDQFKKDLEAEKAAVEAAQAEKAACEAAVEATPPPPRQPEEPPAPEDSALATNSECE
eukprot:TRINITY_DN35859_c0_g1_i1.p1 TRINITY_DN35859_c0_g1~~TRINITY_DN35859_c0_g1_i1.p1  ORF type:complete len:372 (+),score=88.27 TRINITY_DN35859_c0_g1_i1:144-1259(+)